jgi:hypothetical protein
MASGLIPNRHVLLSADLNLLGCARTSMRTFGPGAALADGQLPGGKRQTIQPIRVCYDGRGRNESVLYEVFIRIGGDADYGCDLSIGCDGQTNQ